MPSIPQPPPSKYGPERATLRRLADSLSVVLTPIVTPPGYVGAYRSATAPTPMLALLDYIDELERELCKARGVTEP